MERLGGSQLRVACYPSDTLNVAGIESHLDLWEQQDGFVPDVVITDYADIFAKEPDSPKEFRHSVNKTWKAHRSLAQKRHCCVITATQADADSYDTDLIRRKNFSEDKRKYGHVTGMLTLNQRPDERRAGLMRVGVLLARDEDYDAERTVCVLQCLQIGRPNLGSYPYST